MTESVRDVTGTNGEADDPLERAGNRLLASERRRVTLDVLADLTAPVDLEDVAATVAARQHGIGEADEETIDRVAVSLHHVHLPKMDEMGVVDYDPGTNRIESCPGRPDR